MPKKRKKGKKKKGKKKNESLEPPSEFEFYKVDQLDELEKRIKEMRIDLNKLQIERNYMQLERVCLSHIPMGL